MPAPGQKTQKTAAEYYGYNDLAGSHIVTQAPCTGEGARDLSPGSINDPFSSGPTIVPGSYTIWYGKRTGANIGQPDSWNTKGPIELADGKLYIFDVTKGDFYQVNPKIISSVLTDHPMLTQPTSGESVVWYELSTQYAYVVCFDGPLNTTKVAVQNTTKGGIQLSGSWKMSGHQTGFNDWEAELALNSDSTLGWTETKGANVGATRTGMWQFSGTTFTMSWVSPGSGKTNWSSKSVSENYLGDGTYTVEDAPGGTWTATRTESMPQEQNNEEASGTLGLIHSLKDENSTIRENAADALVEINDTRAVEPLIQSLKDNDSYVRWRSAEALVRINDSRGLYPLIEALEDENWSVRGVAAGGLGELRDKRSVEPLIHALKDNDSHVQTEAAWALGEINDTRAVEPLIQSLKDDNWSVRGMAAWTLGEINDIRAVEPLIQSLKDEDWTGRANAAISLGRINDNRAVEPLIQALKDENENVRSEAKKALTKLGWKEGSAQGQRPLPIGAHVDEGI